MKAFSMDLQKLVEETPDPMLEELRQALGIACSIHTISRALRALATDV